MARGPSERLLPSTKDLCFPRSPLKLVNAGASFKDTDNQAAIGPREGLVAAQSNIAASIHHRRDRSHCRCHERSQQTVQWSSSPPPPLYSPFTYSVSVSVSRRPQWRSMPTSSTSNIGPPSVSLLNSRTSPTFLMNPPTIYVGHHHVSISGAGIAPTPARYEEPQPSMKKL